MPAHSPSTMQPRSAPALPAAVRTAGQSLQDPIHPAPSTTRQPSFVSARTQHSSSPAVLCTQSVQRRSCAQCPNTPHTVQLLCAAQMPRNHGLPSSSAQKSPREDELCPRPEGQDVPQLCDHGQAAQTKLYPGSWGVCTQGRGSETGTVQHQAWGLFHFRGRWLHPASRQIMAATIRNGRKPD